MGHNHHPTFQHPSNPPQSPPIGLGNPATRLPNVRYVRYLIMGGKRQSKELPM
jgi:hypothetical protein